MSDDLEFGGFGVEPSSSKPAFKKLKSWPAKSGAVVPDNVPVSMRNHRSGGGFYVRMEDCKESPTHSAIVNVYKDQLYFDHPENGMMKTADVIQEYLDTGKALPVVGGEKPGRFTWAWSVLERFSEEP